MQPNEYNQQGSPYTAKDIENLFTKFSRFKSQNALSREQLLQILNDLTKQNGFQEFSREIADELFNRIEYYQKRVLCIQTLSEAFIEADEALTLKVNYMQEQEDLLYESLEQLKEIQKYTNNPQYLSQMPQNMRGLNFILLDDVQLQLTDLSVLSNRSQSQNAEPYIVIRMGAYIYESEVAVQKRDDRYRFNIKVQIPIESFVDDLVIQVVERSRNAGQIIDYGQVLLTLESLPHDELKQAPFQLIKGQDPTQNNLILSCQLILGNQSQTYQNMTQKEQINTDKLYQVQQELRMYHEQQIEIRKFVQTVAPQFRKANPSNFYKPQLTQENYQPAPSFVPQYAQDQRDVQKYQRSIDFVPYENAMNVYERQGQDYYNDQQSIQKSQRSYLHSQADLFSQNTLERMKPGPFTRPSKQTQGWQMTSLQQNNLNNQESTYEEMLSRTDILALFTAFLLLFQVKRQDFLGMCLPLYIVMSVMLKKFFTKTHIIALAFIIFMSFSSDCLWLIYYEHHWQEKVSYDSIAEPSTIRKFSIIMIILGMILKVVLGISAGILLKNQNLMYLKRNFLKF